MKSNLCFSFKKKLFSEAKFSIFSKPTRYGFHTKNPLKNLSFGGGYFEVVFKTPTIKG